MVNENIIRDKLIDLSMNINRIKILKDDHSEDEFIQDWRIFTSCERIYEVMIQIMIDICTHIISFYPYKPQNSGECIHNLIQEGILLNPLGENLISSIKMRNLLVHQYGIVDYSLLYNTIEQVISDSNEFKTQILNWLDNLDSHIID